MTTTSVLGREYGDLMSAPASRLIVMLYDEALGAIRDAIAAIEIGDIAGRYQATNRAGEIIEHLCLTLDCEKGGEIAINLAQIYGFTQQLLTRTNLDKDPAPATQAIRLLEPLRESWCALDVSIANGGAEAPRREARSRTTNGAAYLAIAGDRR